MLFRSGTAWASSGDTGLKRINVGVGIGLNGGSWEHEKIKHLEKENVEIKLENGEIRRKYTEVSQKNLEIEQKFEKVKNENAEIKKRLDRIEKCMTR